MHVIFELEQKCSCEFFTIWNAYITLHDGSYHQAKFGFSGVIRCEMHGYLKIVRNFSKPTFRNRKMVRFNLIFWKIEKGQIKSESIWFNFAPLNLERGKISDP